MVDAEALLQSVKCINLDYCDAVNVQEYAVRDDSDNSWCVAIHTGR